MRIGAGPVQVKDSYRDNADEKSINSYRSEYKKKAAGVGALRRVGKEKRDLSENADKSELGWRIRWGVRYSAVTVEALARCLSHPVTQ
jgi:hypothetical protein